MPQGTLKMVKSIYKLKIKLGRFLMVKTAKIGTTGYDEDDGPYWNYLLFVIGTRVPFWMFPPN
jgi:hypothetical protein